MNSLLLYSILLLISYCHCIDIIYNHTNKENNLYFVFTKFRHGARKPFHRVDFFGNRNYSAGALTKYGMIQHLEIGRKYRKRYSNFVNMSFDKNEFYIYSSNVKRTIVSTEKELEGFFNKTIARSNIVIPSAGGYFLNIINLDLKEQTEINKYLASCLKRKLAKNYRDIYYREIFPNIKKCHLMEKTTDSGINKFCDSMISHYFEYTYGNETYNIISRCSKENIQKFYDFCVEYCDSFRGWSEPGAYIFYMLFQHIFQYMDNYINGRSKIKMMMIGGHDVTVGPLMDFLSGLKIIPRTHFPHYSYNIVIELRKYDQDFYLEFYYNDVLKYNNTLAKFKSILDNTKYSNLYNYCGIPSYLNNTNNATNQTINNQTVKNESKIENVINGTNSNVNNQNEKSGNVTQKENQSPQNFTKEKEEERETEKVEILENNPNKNISNMSKNRTNLLNNNNILIELNEKKNQGKNFLQKSFNYLAQQDKNFYILVICAFVIIVTLIAFIIFVFIWRKARKKRYIKFKETVSRNVNPNNISVMTSIDSEAQNETQNNP
jgi:hypothetical protein